MNNTIENNMINKPLGRLAYEYYMQNDVTMTEASLMYGSKTLCASYIRINRLPKKKVSLSEMAYNYYMTNNISKKEASLKFGGPTLVMYYMQAKNLSDKPNAKIYKRRTGEVNLTKLAYEYYIKNDVSKARACVKFNIAKTAITTYIKRHKLPDKERRVSKCKIAYEYHIEHGVTINKAAVILGLNPAGVYAYAKRVNSR